MVVIKIGGNAVTGPAVHTLATDIAALSKADTPEACTGVVLVHGGGPQTSELQKRLGQTPQKIAGRRVTDEAALDAIKMVVGGKLNIDLCAALLKAGALPVGLHGASSCALEAVRRPPRRYPGSDEPIDFGLVGDVVGVRQALIALLHDHGHVPVLACIGASADGSVYNINADTVASRVAVELSADALVLVSDIAGVRRDVDDPASRIATMTAAQSRELIDAGVITAGMIPKLQEAFAAIADGVKAVHIVGELAPGELGQALRDPGSVGTALLSG